MDTNTLAALIAKHPTVKHGDDGTTIITTVCRLSFVHFEKPHTPKGSNKDPRYSCAILIPSAASLDLFSGAERAAWAAGKIPGAPKHRPFKSQSALAAKGYDGFANDGYYFNAETKRTPDVYNADMTPAAPDRFYSGCWARVKVTAQAYDQAGNTGVKFWLNAVQFIADDKKLGGDPAGGFSAASSPATSFGSPAAGPASAPKSTADAFAFN